MAVNEKFTQRVRTLLEEMRVENVQEKKMFRGIAFMINDKMCISIGDQEMMCRIDPEEHDEALSHEGVRTVVMKGKSYKGYVYIHEDHLKTKKQLNYWVTLALKFNPRAVSSKSKKKK